VSLLVAALAWIWIAVQAFALFLFSTVVFDLVHWLLHVFARSRSRALRRIGALHETHHRFLPPDLQVRDELIPANLRHHVIPEYLTHLAVSALWSLVAPLPVVIGAVALQTATVAYILSQRGLDVNHRSRTRVRAYAPIYLCTPDYHALHHAYPDAHYAAYLKTFDHVMGTGASLAGLRIAIAGAETPFGAALGAELARAGAGAIAAVDALDERACALLARSDVLVLLHGAANPKLGSKAALAAVERMAMLARERLVPVEIWASGSGLETRARAGDPEMLAAREFAAHAAVLCGDRRFIYRHLVLPASLGARAADAEAAGLAARRALFFVRRGFRYVPACGLGSAVSNYLRFRRLRGSGAAQELAAHAA
jgi:hypothetical protein